MAHDELVERVTDLEVKVAYQEHTIVALDEVVRELAARIAVLELDLGRLRASATPPGADAPPPAASE